MNRFFRKLPLSIKLMLIGLIPLVFLVYLSGQLYNEKEQHVYLIADQIKHFHEEGLITDLIYELEKERKVSYEYSLKRTSYGNVLLQRPHTDRFIEMLEKSNDLAISGFPAYTFLDRLDDFRNSLDTSAVFPANKIMQYYTNVIFRLNTLNPVSAVSDNFLAPVYQDLIAQKNLFEMITFLSVLRTEIYNMLYNDENKKDNLLSNLGIYDVYKSYEMEFLLKASPQSISLYTHLKDTFPLRPVLAYIDTLFAKSLSARPYTPDEWWKISAEGMGRLKQQQTDLRKKVGVEMNQIYDQEVRSKNKTLVFLITVIILVISVVLFTTRTISQMLRELKMAAQKISKGGTGLHFDNMPDDVMGNLADSILEIDRSNIELAAAANAIGGGNFEIPVPLRSWEDVLGNSLQKMKEDLRQLTLAKDKVQLETLELMNRKDDFLSIASHELKTPVTSLKAYTQLLKMDARENPESRNAIMLSKMDLQVDKLTALITDLLDTSKMQHGKLIYNKTSFMLDELVADTVKEMEMTVAGHQITIKRSLPVRIFADKDRINQVVINLINNAVKYCLDDKAINIQLETRDHVAVCSVQDFGHGITEAQRDKIFERFYRVTGNNLHTFPGLGLGLFIAKEIIERHGGKIWVESEEGRGSTFYFSLPLSAAV